MKKVLIISTSLRKGSNSEVLARECLKGAMEAGHDAELMTLKDKNIGYCTGCLACQNSGKCVIKDDAAEFVEKVKNADSVIFATPIYYYEMCGQMKTLLDRLNPLYIADYAFRDIYMIATAFEAEDHAFEKAYSGLEGWVNCFGKAKLSGIVTGGGIGDPHDAVNHKTAMTNAFELGRRL